MLNASSVLLSSDWNGAGFIFFLMVGSLTFIILGWALIELAIEMFKKHPWKGIRYGATSTSDAIARAVLGDDFPKTLSSRTRPVSKLTDPARLRQMSGPDFGSGFHPGLDENNDGQPYDPDDTSFTRS